MVRGRTAGAGHRVHAGGAGGTGVDRAGAAELPARGGRGATRARAPLPVRALLRCRCRGHRRAGLPARASRSADLAIPIGHLTWRLRHPVGGIRSPLGPGVRIGPAAGDPTRQCLATPNALAEPRRSVARGRRRPSSPPTPRRHRRPPGWLVFRDRAGSRARARARARSAPTAGRGPTTAPFPPDPRSPRRRHRNPTDAFSGVPPTPVSPTIEDTPEAGATPRDPIDGRRRSPEPVAPCRTP